MTEYTAVGNLKVATVLHDLVKDRVAPGTGIEPDDFWHSLEQILNDLGPVNRALLEKREQIQKQIDQWHISRRGQPHDQAQYKAFLQEIGLSLIHI